VVQPFGQKVFDQTSTGQLLAQEKKPDDLALVPAEVYEPASGPLWLWFIPRFDEFIKLISGLVPVKQALDAYWKAKPGTPTLLPDPDTQPLAWLDALGELATVLARGDDQAKTTLAEIGAAIAGAVDAQFTAAKSAADAKTREAVSHERRVLVERRLRPGLAA